MNGMGRAGLALCLAAGALRAGAQSAAGEAAPGNVPALVRPQRAVNPMFVQLLPRLRRTGVLLLLPTRAAMPTGYADIAAARPGYYQIYIGFIHGCNGATACDIGSLEGKRRPAAGKPPGSPVRLAHGIIGYFIPYTCGASCGESLLRWDYQGFRYTVGLKAGLRPRVVKVANSSINAGPV